MRALRIALALAAVACAVGVTAWLMTRDRGRPNVILIVMDTTRADRCSFLGYDRPTTPRLEEFAKTSAVFTDAWSPCCWTAPSHASLFTGLAPGHHGLQDGIKLFLDEGQVTLAEQFKRAGYATAAVSNNDVVSPQFGLTQGFDTVHPLFARTERAYPWAAETHDLAMQWVLGEREAGRPFFLFINDMEPHLPYEPPAAIAAKFIRGTPTAQELDDARKFRWPLSTGFNLGVTQLTKSELDLLADLYDAEIAALDAELGRLFDALAREGALDDTIVVLTADHGESLGEHRRIGHTCTLHRQVLRVPLLVRFPGKFDGGRRVTDVVRLEDVAPTLLELAGIEVPPGLDGVSLLQPTAGRVARAEFGDQSRYVPQLPQEFRSADLSMLSTTLRSVYDGRLHYILDSTGREELYDVKADPQEERNLVPAGGAELVRMRGLLGK